MITCPTQPLHRCYGKPHSRGERLFLSEHSDGASRHSRRNVTFRFLPACKIHVLSTLNIDGERILIGLLDFSRTFNCSLTVADQLICTLYPTTWEKTLPWRTRRQSNTRAQSRRKFRELAEDRTLPSPSPCRRHVHVRTYLPPFAVP